jgi:hypothetical protein
MYDQDFGFIIQAVPNRRTDMDCCAPLLSLVTQAAPNRKRIGLGGTGSERAITRARFISETEISDS